MGKVVDWEGKSGTKLVDYIEYKGKGVSIQFYWATFLLEALRAPGLQLMAILIVLAVLSQCWWVEKLCGRYIYNYTCRAFYYMFRLSCLTH